MLDCEARCPHAVHERPRNTTAIARLGFEPRALAARVAWLRARLGAGDEAIETHFAWVFLVGDRAWKLRKPVCRDPMDYRGLEARRIGAGEEVRLIAVSPGRLPRHASIDPGARRHLCDRRQGRSRRLARGDAPLDRGRMLDVLLAQSRVTAGDLHRVAQLLADFYAREPAW